MILFMGCTSMLSRNLAVAIVPTAAKPVITSYSIHYTKLYEKAKEQLERSLVYAFRDRKQKKRDIRKLWIIRINAACRLNDINYSRFMNGLV